MSDEADLETRLRVVEPGWRFVKERSLAQAHRDLRDRGIRIPASYSLPLVLSKSEAEAIGCFPASAFADAPESLVFVSSPADRGLRYQSLPQQLQHFWRVLYALRVPTAHAIAVWDTLPRVLQREVETVLKASDLVSSDAVPAELASAWAVDLLTHARFDSETLEYRYPGFTDWPVWRGKLCAGFDEAAIYHSTRPAGAAEPQPVPLEPVLEEPVDTHSTGSNSRRAYRLARSAASAERKGNQARCAILYAGAARACSTGSTKYRNDSKEALRAGLVERLGAVLHWEPQQKNAWKQGLQALLIPATEGHWCPAAKALYDLQKIAVDLEGDLFAVDPAAWVTSFGRRPILRKLTISRVAMLHSRLQKVKKLIGNANLDPVESIALFALIDPEIERAEHALRAAMEPILHRVFAEVGFVPSNVVERLALPKIIDELLDTTIAKGFLRFGDLRDILSRNRLKMPDLAGPGQLLFGDALLQADAKLGEELDGVYYPGEIYLRWFQRGSALAFGTKVGRLVTRFVALPFGAAFMTVEFAKYMAHEATTIAGFVAGLFLPKPEASVEEHEHKHHGITMTPESVAILLTLGVLYLGLIHSSAMRAFALQALSTVASVIRWVFAELPSKVWNSTPMRAVRRNRAVRWINRRLAVPVLGTGAVALLGSDLDWSETVFWPAIGGTFALLALVLNTTSGQSIQEQIEDALTWLWRQVRANFFPGLIGWIVWIFRELLAGLDQLIYSIDEWFRFREGQTKPSLAVKVALGLIWFPVRYVLRFAIYLLIEPQINPLKHFPVVTVSHKLLLPLIPAISTATGIAKEFVAGALAGVPGIFGFLAWELKENWRIYAANRSERLQPLALGHHGESVRALLRPGFHSGTVPKAFAAIRRAIEKAGVTGAVPRLQKPLETLHHVEHAMHHFVDRELLAYLNSSTAWSAQPLKCSGVHLGLQHIRFEITGSGAPAIIRLELHGSAVAGECESTAFLASATAEQRECWERAVLGFFAMGAVPVDDARLNWTAWVEFWEAREGEPAA